jgi:hypothetical protein
MKQNNDRSRSGFFFEMTSGFGTTVLKKMDMPQGETSDGK